MAKINQGLTTDVGIEVIKIEGKTYEELVEIARQNNEARRLELEKQDQESNEVKEEEE